MDYPAIFSYVINGLPVQTGDILCTQAGVEGADQPEAIQPGEFWHWVGQLVPGEVDHVAIYLGPGGLCIESGPWGVISFTVEAGWWNAPQMMSRRGNFVDTFYGVAYPLAGRGLPPEAEVRLRAEVAAFCTAQLGKPYNKNLFNLDQDDSFYCSQLAYRAYQPHGINLNSRPEIKVLPLTQRIVYPQEIWDSCHHRRWEPKT